MFTGLIQDVGTLRAAVSGSPRRLEIATSLPVDDFRIGESVAVNGVCLTVVTTAEGAFVADAGAETLARTTAASWQAGARLHLERALALGDRLGGHLVLGHVDGVGKVLASRAQAGGHWLEIESPPAVAPFLLPKGSIAIDGVSLTVNALAGEGGARFEVFLIPETLRRTALPRLVAGATVNLEADILGKYVARLLGRSQTLPGLTLEALKAAGFA